MVKIGLIREEKKPHDKRAALSPEQCRQLLAEYSHLQIAVQTSEHRCFSDAEYSEAGCAVQENMEDCDLLLGIKEVPQEFLVPGKTYLFFSHTIKKQPYNKQMLQQILEKKIRLIDYECLVWENGNRIIGFGRYAGIVGTHNGLRAFGKKSGAYFLPPAYTCFDYRELLDHYRNMVLPPVKIALCGDGRVAHGSIELLDHLKIRQVTPRAYLVEDFDEPVYVHLRVDQLYENKDNSPFDKSYFYHNPADYFSIFNQYYPVTDMLVNAVYWSEKIPRHFSLEEMERPDFRIKVIADISCDINGSVPATVRATTIEDPVYGWHPAVRKEAPPYLPGNVDIMAVSNLPCELPRDASNEFGSLLVKYICPALLGEDRENIIERATIAEKGQLRSKYAYLKDFVESQALYE
jgi:saccharopine dehydrogenase (NAD+, L-lysine-forming)